MILILAKELDFLNPLHHSEAHNLALSQLDGLLRMKGGGSSILMDLLQLIFPLLILVSL